MGVYDCGSESGDQRAEQMILLPIAPRSHNNGCDWHAKGLEPGFEWVALRLAWNDDCRDVDSVHQLTGGHHGDYLLQAAFSSRSEHVKDSRACAMRFNRRHRESLRQREDVLPRGGEIPEERLNVLRARATEKVPGSGYPGITEHSRKVRWVSIYSFLKNRALTLLPDSTLQPLRVWHHRGTLSSFPDNDEPDVAVVRALVERGSTAVDLGANIGVYTKVLSDLVGPTGSVISVEPVPQTFGVLAQLIRSLRMNNVSCVNVAISDSAGEVVMELPDYEAGGTNFYQATVVGAADKAVIDSRHVRVPSQTLDAIVAGKGRVGFVKCDVEGHELACLSGAKTVLSSHRPAWLVEVWGNPDETGTRAEQTFTVFENLSYDAWWFDGQRLKKRRPGERSTNYFFLKDTHVAKLKAKAPQFFSEQRASSAVRT